MIKRKLMIKEIFLHFIEIGCLVFKLLAQTCLLVRTWLLVSDLLERTLLLQTGLLKRTLLGQTGFLTRAWLVQTGLLVGRPVDLYRQVYLYVFFTFVVVECSRLFLHPSIFFIFDAFKVCINNKWHFIVFLILFLRRHN